MIGYFWDDDSIETVLSGSIQCKLIRKPRFKSGAFLLLPATLPVLEN